MVNIIVHTFEPIVLSTIFIEIVKEQIFMCILIDSVFVRIQM
jgi:hypothetical protein